MRNESTFLMKNKTIKESGGYIVTQYVRGNGNEDDWEGDNEMERGIVVIERTNGEEVRYKRIGEICLWGGRYIYKNFATR